MLVTSVCQFAQFPFLSPNARLIRRLRSSRADCGELYFLFATEGLDGNIPQAKAGNTSNQNSPIAMDSDMSRDPTGSRVDLLEALFHSRRFSGWRLPFSGQSDRRRSRGNGGDKYNDKSSLCPDHSESNAASF